MPHAKVVELNKETISPQLADKLMQLMMVHNLGRVNQLLNTMVLFYLQEKLPDKLPVEESNTLPGIIALIHFIDMAADESTHWHLLNNSFPETDH